MFDVLLSRSSILVLLLLGTFGASAATRYVWQGSPNPGPPYTNWATAAPVIQDAVEAAQPGDIVRVTNGVYSTGGRPVGTNLLVYGWQLSGPSRWRA